MNTLVNWTGLSPEIILFVSVCALGAGLCRGFAGFGLSALIVSSLTLVLTPDQVVPIALILEMVVSLVMMRITWSDIHWPLLKRLCAGALIGVPIGVLVLKFAPASLLQAMLSALVLLASLALLFGSSLSIQENHSRNLFAGIFSGIANGAASLGGLPTAIYMMAAGLSAVIVRATLNIYFLLIDIYGSGVLIYAGLFSQQTLIRALLLLLPTLLGLGLGLILFDRSSSRQYRIFVLLLLITLGTIGLLKAIP